MQKYIGEGARMVRELFVMAREHAPTIIFMDEIDSIGGTRVESSHGGDSGLEERRREREREDKLALSRFLCFHRVFGFFFF